MDIGQDSCEEIIDRGKNRNRCGIDRSRYCGKECGNRIPDVCEKISDRLKCRTNAVPDADKEVFD